MWAYEHSSPQGYLSNLYRLTPAMWCTRRLGSGGAQLTADGCSTSHGCCMTSPSTSVCGGAEVCCGADSCCCDDDGGWDGAQSLFALHHRRRAGCLCGRGGLAVSVLLIRWRGVRNSSSKSVVVVWGRRWPRSHQTKASWCPVVPSRWLVMCRRSTSIGILRSEPGDKDGTGR